MRLSLSKALATVALTIALTGCDSAEDRAAEHYERGMTLLEDGDPQRAQLEFRNAARLDETFAAPRFELASLAEARGDFARAFNNYRNAAELDDADTRSRIAAARILSAAGDLEEATSYVEAALAIAPDDPDALAVKAVLLLREGADADATAMARRALQSDPNLETAIIVLVSERLRADAADEALAIVDDALARTPEARALNLTKFQILSQQNRSDALRDHLVVMTERFPEEVGFRRALAQFYAQSGDVESAEAELRKIADAEDAGPEAALMLVRLIYENRGAEAAETELTRRINAAPDIDAAFPLIAARAELDYTAGRTAAAIAGFDSVIEEHPDSDAALSARVRLAHLQLATGDIDGARALADEVVEMDESNVEALALRAAILLDEDKPRDALRDLEVAIDADPRNVQLLLLTAQAHQLNGNQELASERLAAAARISGFAPEVALRYVSFLTGRNQTAAAESVLVEASRRAPDNVDLLSALARIRLALQDWVGAEEVAARLRNLDSTDATDRGDAIRAAALSGRGRYDESISLLQSLGEQPRNAQAALAALVANYVRAGQIDEAQNLIVETLEREPDNIQALLLQAELDLVRSDRDSARRRLEQIIATEPESPVGYAALVRLMLQQGELDTARTTIDQGIAATGDTFELRLQSAQLYEFEGAFDEAIAEYEKLYEARRDSIVIANNLTSLLVEHRYDDEEAMDRAGRIGQRLRGSEVPHFQDTYGWLLYHRGAYEQALRELIPAAEALPDNALVRYHLGMTYAELEQSDNAREHLEAAIALDAGFPGVDKAQAALAALPLNEN